MNQEDLQENLAAGDHLARRSARPLVTPSTGRVVAFKFGGTSMLGAERILHVAGLVRDAAQTSRVVVVVSAMKGVTDRLLFIGQSLAAGHFALARAEAGELVHLHRKVLSGLRLELAEYDRMHHDLQLLAGDLLHEVSLPRPARPDAALLDRLASFGERFSARLLAAALEKHGVAAVPVASSDFVLTCDNFRDAQPHLEQTKQQGCQVLLPLLEDGVVPVVTGFIGAAPDGRITTLGRNSSDFSGAIVAHVVDAAELVIWTDVDGIFTANPNESAEAELLHNLSYDEAHALAAAGANVLHPRVLPLAAETEMTVWVRNTFTPHGRGTRIGPALGSSGMLQQGGAA